MPSSLRSPLAPVRTIIAGTLGRMQPRSPAIIVRLTEKLPPDRPATIPDEFSWQRALTRETMQSSRRRCTRTESRAEGRSDSRAALEQPRLAGQVPEGASDPPRRWLKMQRSETRRKRSCSPVRRPDPAWDVAEHVR